MPLVILSKLPVVGYCQNGVMMIQSTQKKDVFPLQNLCLASIDGDYMELKWYMRGTYQQIFVLCSQFNQPMVDLFLNSSQTQRELWIQMMVSFRDFSLDDMKESNMIKWKAYINRMEMEIVSLRRLNSSIMISLTEAQSMMEPDVGSNDDHYNEEEVLSIFNPSIVQIWPIDEEKDFAGDRYQDDNSSMSDEGSDGQEEEQEEEEQEESEEDRNFSLKCKTTKRIKLEVSSSDEEIDAVNRNKSLTPRKACKPYVFLPVTKVSFNYLALTLHTFFTRDWQERKD